MNWDHFLNRRHELNVHQGCVMWGNKVIIPNVLRDSVLNELHTGHIGTVKWELKLGLIFWWPKLDEAIEFMCKSCEGCKLETNQATADPVHPWSYPGSPWYRLHIDFAGPFKDKMLLIVIDAFQSGQKFFICVQLRRLRQFKFYEHCSHVKVYL